MLANNTDIQIQRLSVEQPRNAILRGYSIFDPLRHRWVHNDAPADTRQRRSRGRKRREPADAAVHVPLGSRYCRPVRRTTSTSTTPSNRRTARFRFSIPHTTQGSTRTSLSRCFETADRISPSFRSRSPAAVCVRSEYAIQDQILRLVANAENAYWQVISARENLRVQEQALALFDQSLKRAQRELELGAISELGNLPTPRPIRECRDPRQPSAVRSPAG